MTERLTQPSGDLLVDLSHARQQGEQTADAVVENTHPAVLLPQTLYDRVDREPSVYEQIVARFERFYKTPLYYLQDGKKVLVPGVPSVIFEGEVGQKRLAAFGRVMVDNAGNMIRNGASAQTFLTCKGALLRLPNDHSRFVEGIFRKQYGVDIHTAVDEPFLNSFARHMIRYVDGANTDAGSTDNVMNLHRCLAAFTPLQRQKVESRFKAVHGQAWEDVFDARFAQKYVDRFLAGDYKKSQVDTYAAASLMRRLCAINDLPVRQRGHIEDVLWQRCGGNFEAVLTDAFFDNLTQFFAVQVATKEEDHRSDLVFSWNIVDYANTCAVLAYYENLAQQEQAEQELAKAGEAAPSVEPPIAPRSF